MISIKSLEAFDYVTYDHFKLVLDAPLITIRGRNHDSKSKDGLNRVGKSLIPSVIPRLLFRSPPQPMKATKRGEKDVFRKTTKIHMDIRKSDNSYRIQEYFDRTVRLKILENKNNRGIRLKDVAEEAVRELFPHNEEQFYSSVYIDGRRPAVFQYGTDAQRFEFFEKVFDFDIYRQLGDALKPLLQNSSKQTTERTILEEELIALGDPPDLASFEKTVCAVEKQLSTHRKIVEKYRSQKRRLDIYVSALNTIPEEKIESLDFLADKIAQLSRRIEKAIVAEEQTRLFEETASKRKAFTQQLETEFGDITIDPDIQNTIAQLRAQCDQVENEWDDYNRSQAKLIKQKNLLETLVIHPKVKALSIDLIQADLEKTQSRIDFMQRLKSALSNMSDHEKTCPVCNGDFDYEAHVAFSERMDSALTAAVKRQRILKQGLVWHQHCQTYQDLRNSAVKKPDHTIQNLESRLDVLNRRYQQMRRKVILRQRLDALPNISKPEHYGNISKMREENLYYLKQHQLAQRVQQARQILKTLNISLSKSDAQKHLVRLVKILPESERHLSILEERFLTAKSKRHDAQQTRKRLSVIQTRLEELDKQLKDQPILEGLKAAFGSRGLVKQRTQMIAEAFENALNDYAPFVFDEPISFKLDISETRFSIFAIRNGLRGEVRSLSGQESRAFSLITLLSLHRFLPTHLRVNMVVLDEIESNVDAPSRKLLGEKLIPELLRFVDHVIIVTPLSRAEFFIPNAKELYVIKKDGKSTLMDFDELRKAA